MNSAIVLKYMLLLVVLSLGLFCVSTDITTTQKEGMVMSLMKHYRINKISLLISQENDQEESDNLVTLGRYLTSHFVFIATAHPLDINPEIGVLYVFMSSNGLRDFLQKLNSNFRLSNTLWLLFMDVEETLEQYVGDIHVPFDCEFLVAHRTGDQVFALTEVYRVTSNLTLQENRFGNWTRLANTFSSAPGLHQRRNNLLNVVLRGGIIEGPATSILRTSSGEIKGIGRFIGQVWNILEKVMNFTTVYSEAVDNAFGVKNSDNSWNGMLGMIQRDEIDVISTDILMNQLRLSIVNFMKPLFEVKTYMFIQHPEQRKMNWGNLLKPFNRGLWLAVIGASTFLAICRFISINASHRYGGNPSQYLKFQFRDCVLYTYHCFCLQAQKEPAVHPTSSRVITLTTYLTAVVLFVGYSGFLISYLTFRTEELPFNTFTDFLHDGTYGLGVLSNSVHYAHFKETTNPTMRSLYERLIHPKKDKQPKSFLEGLYRVCEEERYAFMAPVFIANSYLNQLQCRLVVVPGAVIPATATIALSKRSNFHGLFSYNIQKLRRSGILKKSRQQYLAEKLLKLETRNRPSGLDEVEPIFAILLLGIILSNIFLLMEIVNSRLCLCGSKKKRSIFGNKI